MAGYGGQRILSIPYYGHKQMKKKVRKNSDVIFFTLSISSAKLVLSQGKHQISQLHMIVNFVKISNSALTLLKQLAPSVFG